MKLEITYRLFDDKGKPIHSKVDVIPDTDLMQILMDAKEYEGTRSVREIVVEAFKTFLGRMSR